MLGPDIMIKVKIVDETEEPLRSGWMRRRRYRKGPGLCQCGREVEFLEWTGGSWYNNTQGKCGACTNSNTNNEEEEEVSNFWRITTP